MVRFILGLIAGFLIGVVVMVYNPQFAAQVDDAVTETTGTVLRGTEEAAEAVGDAARRATDGTAEQPTIEPGGAAQ